MKKNPDAALERLRERLLNNELQHADLTEKDYKRLLKYESKQTDPNAAVLDFCVEGLKRFPYYRKNPFISIVLPIAAGTLLTVSLIDAMLGLNLFSYVFNWNFDKEVVVVSRVGEERPSLPKFAEDILEYDNAEDMPEALAAFCPQYLLEHFSFLHGAYRSIEDWLTLSFYFMNGDEIYQYFVMDSKQTHIEREGDWTETEFHSGIQVTYFLNAGYYQAMWEIDNAFYTLGMGKDLDAIQTAVKHILG